MVGRASLRVALASVLVGLPMNALAQYHGFGRNKVQYTDFDWHVLETEHFDIYYYPEMEDLARMGAEFAEESYRILSDRFNHALNRRVPLIFYSAHLYFQQTNVTPFLVPEGVGGFFEFLKGRVVIPSDGSINDFKRVIRHELVHVMMHSKLTRVQKDHHVLTPTAPPLWFTEGLAEYWSGVWDTQAEMVLRDAVLNDYLVPLHEMSRIRGSYLMYKEGQSVLHFIARTYGEEKILLLMENFWKEKRFSEVMKTTIGKNYKELDREWLYFLKKKYYPILEDADHPSMVAEALAEDGFNSKPTFYRAADGSPMVAYVGNRLGYTNIYVQPLKSEGRKAEVLVKGERTDEFETFHLFRSSIDVHDRLLAFVTKSGETDVLHTYEIDADRLAASYRFPDIVAIASPAWSPDGKSLAFVGQSKSGNNDLYVYTSDADKLRMLTNDFYDDRDPSWSPDGSQIVFSSDRTEYGVDGHYNLFTIHLESLDISYLTYGPFRDSSPSWSPNGDILFSSDRGGMTNIWLLRPRNAGSGELIAALSAQTADAEQGQPQVADLFRYEAYPVTRFTTAALDPTWTDEGGILFTAFENFSFRILRLNGDQTPLADAQPFRDMPSLARPAFWRPAQAPLQPEANSRRYRNRYSLDIAQSQVIQDPVFGTTGGALFALSDVLGNNQYYFLIYNNARTASEIPKSFNLAVTRISLSRRTDYAYGLYHFSGLRYNPAEFLFEERRYGGLFALRYPLSKFRRIDATANYSVYAKRKLAAPLLRAWLAANFLSFVQDNSIWGPTGPLDGERINITLGYTLDVRYSHVNYYTVIADYRRYFRLTKRMSYATRLMGLFSDGKEAHFFFIGGSWTLRGYPRFGIYGHKAFVINNELRFPFIEALGVKFPVGGLRLGGIQGAVFMDFGSAWNDKFGDLWADTYGKLMGAYGIGFRFALGGVLVLRLDIGKRTDFHSIERATFKQFFFGWDF